MYGVRYVRYWYVTVTSRLRGTHVSSGSNLRMPNCQRHLVWYTVSQISLALTGLAARANHLIYRFRTVFRVPYVIRPWYESRVRSVSLSNFLLGARPCDRSARALVVFVLYSLSFRYQFVIIRILCPQIHMRYSYEKFYSFFQSFQSN